jgi:hypothetical protein
MAASPLHGAAIAPPLLDGRAERAAIIFLREG